MAPTSPLTEPDRALLRFAAEHRFVLAAQVAHVLGVTVPVARRRLGALSDAGLLRAQRPLRHEPTAYGVTRPGVAAIDGDLPAPPALDLGEYRHDVGVTWLAVGARRGRFGALESIVEERRMRSEDRRADRPAGTPTHGVRIGSGTGRGPRLHYPDLVLRTASGRRIAIELELSTKSPARRERILRAYASDRSVDGVFYLVPTAAAARAIERSAVRVGARDLVRVQRFDWADGRRPGDPPAAARTAVQSPRPPRGPAGHAARPGVDRSADRGEPRSLER